MSQLVCASCGHHPPPAARYCNHCGTPLPTETTLTAPSQRRAAAVPQHRSYVRTGVVLVLLVVAVIAAAITYAALSTPTVTPLAPGNPTSPASLLTPSPTASVR